MKRIITIASYAALSLALSGCQYASFFKTNRTDYNKNTGAEATCEEMGASRGTAYLDWCVRREELDRGNNEFGF